MRAQTSASYSITSYIVASLAFVFGLSKSAYSANERNFRGIPYYSLFTSRDFNSGASAVFLTTAADGTIFYGDRNWVFQYDGSTWHKVYQNSNTSEKITALLWDPDGSIYAGGFNLFGKLTVNELNEPAFHSLVPHRGFENGEAIVKIESTAESVYLTGKRSFAHYHKAKGETDLHVLSTWITASFLMNGEYHLLTDNNDILRYQDGQLTKLDEVSNILGASGITVADIVVDSDGSAIMASERRGIYRFDGSSISEAYPSFEYSSENLTTDIELISDNRLVIASLGGGITVLDQEGNTIEELGPKTDYRFKSARAVEIDKSGTVWAMFNNTVAKVLLDSPLTAIDERIRPSFFYASQHLHEGELYVRSFYILYKAVFDKNGRISHFVNALPGSELEIWSVAQTDDGLYLNTADNGIFLFENGTADFLVESEAYDRFEHSKTHPNFIVGANSNSIALYEKSGKTLSLVDRIANPGGFINRLFEDRDGYFWIEYGLGRTARVAFEGGGIQLQSFASEYGIPPNDWGSLWIHDGIAHLNTGQKTLLLDPAQKPFSADAELQAVVGSDEFGVGRAFTDPEVNLWISANNKNLIFWKQEDGSYLRDETSLSEMGEPYFESIEFLDNGDALIMTSFEFFHFQKDKRLLENRNDNFNTRIISIEDPEDNDRLFTSLGNNESLSRLALNFAHNNLRFTVSNNFTYTTNPPEFQFILQGFSDESISQNEQGWSESSSISYTNLQPGNYTFKARTKLGNGAVGPWVQLPLEISPPLHRTTIAFLVYLIVFILLIQVFAKFNSARLRKRNQELERKVKNRTREIENKNTELKSQADLLESKNNELKTQSEEIQKNASDLAKALIQLNDTQDKLLTTARIAGRAEVANNVLHSVGNVLNSVNTGLSNLDNQVKQSRAKNFKSIVSLIKENEDSLTHFFQHDERGKQIPNYLDQLADALRNELDSYSRGIREIHENVDHIKMIVATQQTHAKRVGVEQEVHIAELLESALTVTLGESYENSYTIERDYDWDLVSYTDKHLVLDVVINLIKNAKESMSHLAAKQRLLRLSCRSAELNKTQISITDNGSGIAPESKSKLFTHGFTTKSDGHGFGLHGSANALKSIGGSLKLESEGPAKGATATIALPG
ncbi:ATP-binding protein [Pelagicoccus sp. SDUM812002]|uniref:ATP-binding protein n=1 Tax=Pelagicoccus sp. SDUM812002 TaxID=3041266 RepID=UPI00280CAAE4|nr:ATP-binding protein [Pelagicoccus sp. SDUM812002]MDQ8187276.1 ATP-binding protein [Pelagicoccus sp. SDUM812002]